MQCAARHLSVWASSFMPIGWGTYKWDISSRGRRAILGEDLTIFHFYFPYKLPTGLHIKQASVKYTDRLCYKLYIIYIRETRADIFKKESTNMMTFTISNMDSQNGHFFFKCNIEVFYKWKKKHSSIEISIVQVHSSSSSKMYKSQ